MQVGVIFASIMVYALAIFLWRRDHTPTYFVALLAAHLAVLLSPFWQALYVFRYSEDFPTFYRLGSVAGIQALTRLQAYVLPRPVFLGAWAMMLAPLAIFYLYRHRWWFPSYLTSLLTFILFVLYHLLVETVGLRQGWWSYQGGALPLGTAVVADRAEEPLRGHAGAAGRPPRDRRGRRRRLTGGSPGRRRKIVA